VAIQKIIETSREAGVLYIQGLQVARWLATFLVTTWSGFPVRGENLMLIHFSSIS